MSLCHNTPRHLQMVALWKRQLYFHFSSDTAGAALQLRLTFGVIPCDTMWYFTSKIKSRKKSDWNCVMSKYLQSSLYLFLTVYTVSHALGITVLPSLSLVARWCIKRQRWPSARWPLTRRGRRSLTSLCPLWRLASASWCHAATGPSRLQPSSVNPSLSF